MYVTDDRNFSLSGHPWLRQARRLQQPRSCCWSTDTASTTTSSARRRSAPSSASIPAIFERVEIIRGPASSLYGDSAFFAVVNVITKLRRVARRRLARGRDRDARHPTGARHRRSPASPAASTWRSSATYEQSDGVSSCTFPAFDSPDTNFGIAEDLDGERLGQFYGRFATRTSPSRPHTARRRQACAHGLVRHLVQRAGSPEQSTDRHTLADVEYSPGNRPHAADRAGLVRSIFL